MSRGVTVDFNANVARFTSAIDKATNDLSKFQSNASRIGRNINSSLGAIGVGLSAAGLVAFTKSTIDSLDKLHDLSITTGISVERLSGLSVAAKQSGTDLDGVAASVAKLSTNMGKGSEKFREIGISATDPLEALKQVADIYVSIVDPAQKAAFASVAFGKSWQSMAPLLAEGGAAIGRMVVEGEKASGVTKKMTDDADKFNDQLEIMKSQLGGVVANIVGGVLPAFNDMLLKFRQFTSGDSVESLTQKLDKLKTMRDELQKPSAGNKINNFLFNDLETVNKQITSTEQKIRYLNNLSKTVKVADFAQPSAPSGGPSQSVLKKFIGDDGELKKAASDLDALKKAGQALMDSIDPLTKRNTELAKYTEYLRSGVITQEAFNEAVTKSINNAELDRLKPLRDAMEFEAQQAEQFYDARDRAAKDAAQSIEELKREGAALASAVDPIVKRNEDLKKYTELLDAGVISQDTFNKAATKSIEDAEAALKGTTGDMSAILIGFQTNVQRSIGSGLYDIMSGNFKNIGSAFADLMKRMVADALAAQLSKAIFGTGTGGGLLGGLLNIGSALLGGLGGLGSAAGGATRVTSGGLTGFAANGAYFDGNVSKFASGGIFDSPTQFRFASGGQFKHGVMGEAGPEAIMPLKRDANGRLGVSGGGQAINYAPVINIDSRTDRAEVYNIVTRAVKNGNNDLVEKLHRQGKM